MKRILILLIAIPLVHGCAAAFMAAAVDMERQNRAELTRTQCLNQYGFLVNARYEWVEHRNNPHQVLQSEYVFRELYVERVARGSFAEKKNIKEGDVISLVDGQAVTDINDLSSKYVESGYRINTVTFKKADGTVFDVAFEN